MDNIRHEIELYSLDKFKTLLEHEVRKSRRYKYPLSFVHIALAAEPNDPKTQHAAEMIAINALDTELRDTDIPCRDGHEFLVLLPSTDENGARVASERLQKLLNKSTQTQDGAAFQAFAFIGISSIYDDLLLTSEKLMEEARKAMEYARENKSQKAVLFSQLM